MDGEEESCFEGNEDRKKKTPRRPGKAENPAEKKGKKEFHIDRNQTQGREEGGPYSPYLKEKEHLKPRWWRGTERLIERQRKGSGRGMQRSREKKKNTAHYLKSNIVKKRATAIFFAKSGKKRKMGVRREVIGQKGNTKGKCSEFPGSCKREKD